MDPYSSDVRALIQALEEIAETSGGTLWAAQHNAALACAAIRAQHCREANRAKSQRS